MSRFADEQAALDFLRSDEGPPRFAEVGPGLYRGGQPTREHLEALRALGVRTVITLRREQRKLWRQEQLQAEELGMRFYRFPFYGVFGAAPPFLRAILQRMREGGIYIHCKNGRDRTSLLVALYRVVFEDWHPDEAWTREVLGYGHRETSFYRRVRHTFRRFLDAHAETRAPDRAHDDGAGMR